MTFCSRLNSTIFVILCLLTQWSFAGMEPNYVPISEKEIVDSTWSMHCWQVLGWKYDSPFWIKGNEEIGQVGEKGQVSREKNVRAVCLGEEGNFYVFFTLRSFVDASFPNLYLQGVNVIPYDKDGKPFSDSAINNQSYIRYGGLILISYADRGGGTFEISKKISGVTHCDSENPICYGRTVLGVPFLKKHEIINNVSYEVPHEKVSAKQHMELLKEPKIEIKFPNEHDVALLYLPKTLFSTKPYSLGIKNPTLSVRLMLEHTKDLFGFKFVLIGQETLDMIKNYTPDSNPDFRGFQKLFMLAGLALGPETLQMMKIVDSALDRNISDDKLAYYKNHRDPRKAMWDDAVPLIEEIIKDKQTLKAMTNYIVPIVFKTVMGVN